MLRGGSWFDGKGCCRLSYRYGGAPSYGYYYIGLRLALPTRRGEEQKLPSDPDKEAGRAL